MNAFNRYSKTFCAEAVMDEGSELHNTTLVYCTEQGDIFVHNDNQTIFCYVGFCACTLAGLGLSWTAVDILHIL